MKKKNSDVYDKNTDEYPFVELNLTKQDFSSRVLFPNILIIQCDVILNTETLHAFVAFSPKATQSHPCVSSDLIFDYAIVISKIVF